MSWTLWREVTDERPDLLFVSPACSNPLWLLALREHVWYLVEEEECGEIGVSAEGKP